MTNRFGFLASNSEFTEPFWKVGGAEAKSQFRHLTHIFLSDSAWSEN